MKHGVAAEVEVAEQLLRHRVVVPLEQEEEVAGDVHGAISIQFHQGRAADRTACCGGCFAEEFHQTVGAHDVGAGQADGDIGMVVNECGSVVLFAHGACIAWETERFVVGDEIYDLVR